MWKEDDKPKKAVNLIAIELVRKIVEAIKAGEHHSVYCIIPMYPEGDPSSAPVSNTLYMMYYAVIICIIVITCTIFEREIPTFRLLYVL